MWTLCTWSSDGAQELSNADKSSTGGQGAWSDGGWGGTGDFTGSRRIRVELIGGVPPSPGKKTTGPLGEDDYLDEGGGGLTLLEED